MHIISFETVYMYHLNVFYILICKFSFTIIAAYMQVHVLLAINILPNEDSRHQLCAAICQSQKG